MDQAPVQVTPLTSPKVQTSITIEPEVMAFLDTVARAEDRTRSQVISRIVRREAERHGHRFLPVQNLPMAEEPAHATS